MKKSDLKSGLFVKTRNNSFYMVMLDSYLYEYDKNTNDFLVNIQTGKFSYLFYYNEDLTSEEDEDLDIIEIYKADYFGTIFTENEPIITSIWKRN